MMILITYDVNTETKEGRKRLRRVARECVNYGHRVQNSVFECQIDAAMCRKLKGKLLDLIDEDKDSLRIYYLGNNYKNRIEQYGANTGFDVSDTMIF
jgi:CRISPR-associated protein Cas2